MKEESRQPTDRALEKHRWTPVKLLGRKSITHDTRCYTFQLQDENLILGVAAGQHLELAFHMEDRMLIRPYTPTRPLLPRLSPKSRGTNDPYSEPHNDLRDGNGRFDLTIKTYFPNDNQPGGAMSNILDCLPLGEDVDMRGPIGDVIYEGNGNFKIYGEERAFNRISMVLGGSGVTPGYSLMARILLSEGDKTGLRVIDANKTEDDILMRAEIDKLAKESEGQMKVTHVLSDANDSWKGLRGFVTEDILRSHLFGPSEESVMFLCGPPMMMNKAVLPALDSINPTPVSTT